MVASTFAYTAVQTFTNQKSGQVKLPDKNVIDYELDSEQENLALTSGLTLAKIYYYSGCVDCNTKMSFLEYIASQYPDQIIVEEVMTNRTTSLSIKSYYGQKNFVNATQDQMFKAFCDVMVQPPITCAVK
jgi:hypothetical protein